MTAPVDPDGLRLEVLRSGSGGNAVLVEAEDTRLLVDAGLPLEAIARDLAVRGRRIEELTAVLLTHEHDDHARGAGAVARAAGVPVLGTAGTMQAAAALLGPVEVCALAYEVPTPVGPLRIEPFPVPHDAAEAAGFLVEHGGRRLLIALDLGEVTGPLRERLPDADLLLLEANYDLRLLGVGPYPWFLKNRIIGPTGHLSNEAAAEAAVWAARGGRRQVVVLAHLSDVNNLTPLARDVVLWALERESITTTVVDAVRPNAPSRVFRVAGGGVAVS